MVDHAAQYFQLPCHGPLAATPSCQLVQHSSHRVAFIVEAATTISISEMQFIPLVNLILKYDYGREHSDLEGTAQSCYYEMVEELDYQHPSSDFNCSCLACYGHLKAQMVPFSSLCL